MKSKKMPQDMWEQMEEEHSKAMNRYVGVIVWAIIIACLGCIAISVVLQTIISK